MVTTLYRGYGHQNDELIEKAITLAKEVVLDYYESIAYDYPPLIKTYVDKKRADVHKEMIEVLDFFKEKKNIGKVLEFERWNAINDVIMSAVVLFHTYLVKLSGELDSEELDMELNNIQKILGENKPTSVSDFEKYIRLYDEIINIMKIRDTLPEDEEMDES
jgi:hypothetical protein